MSTTTRRVTTQPSCVAVLKLAIGVLFISLLFVTPALAGQGYEKVTTTFGSPGTGPGHFKEPTSIAVNDETGDVYVLDSGNDRVEWFSPQAGNTFKFEGEFNGSKSPTGEFLNPEGIAVDNSTDPSDLSQGDVYVADRGHDVVDKFSATGVYLEQLTGTCKEAGETPPLCTEASKRIPFVELMNVAVDPSGNLWVLEGNGPIVQIQEMQADELSDTGSSIRTQPLRLAQRQAVNGFAVDSLSDLYVTHLSFVYEFVNATTNEGIAITEHASPLATLAIISSTGNLLVDEGSGIELFKSPFVQNEDPLLTFPATGLSESAGIAVNGAKGEGTIYATQRKEDDVDVLDSEPAKAPVIVPGSESASTVGPENNEVKFAAVIDPENRTTKYSFEYSSEVKTNAQGEPVRNAEGELELEGTIETIAGEKELPAEFGDQTAGSPVVPLSGYRKTWYYRVLTENEESHGTPTVGKVEEYTKLPLIANEQFSASALTSTSATLEATVNSVFANTSYWFEFAPHRALLEASTGTVEESGATVVSSSFREIEGAGPEPFSTEIPGLEPGHTYFYRVVATNAVSEYTGNANKGAPVRGPIEQVTPYGAPAIVTGAAQNITPTAATLSGTVNPERTEATYHFAYITETGYQEALANGAANPASPHYREELAKGAPSPYAEGETTPTFSLAASGSPQAVGPIPADDLLPGVTYHYALIAVNKFELQTIGPDQTFTTGSATPPSVSTGAASAISQNAATLSGTVTTNGLQTNYGFEIGTEPFQPGKYVPATGLGAIGGAATEEVHVTLGELQPGTTYYYRVTATNADGTREGQPGVFTTPGFPTLLAPPASALLIPYTSPGFPKEEKASGTSTKTLTNKQKLAKALKQCKKDKSKSKRTTCEKAARKKYPTGKKKGKVKK
jgi:NHL repeat